jgi:hypothetical protein
MKIIIRVLSSPFFFGLYLVLGLHIALKGTYCFIRYGGEMLTYMQGDKETIANIYNELKEGRP